MNFAAIFLITRKHLTNPVFLKLIIADTLASLFSTAQG